MKIIDFETAIKTADLEFSENTLSTWVSLFNLPFFKFTESRYILLQKYIEFNGLILEPVDDTDIRYNTNYQPFLSDVTCHQQVPQCFYDFINHIDTVKNEQFFDNNSITLTGFNPINQNINDARFLYSNSPVIYIEQLDSELLNNFSKNRRANLSKAFRDMTDFEFVVNERPLVELDHLSHLFNRFGYCYKQVLPQYLMGLSATLNNQGYTFDLVKKGEVYARFTFVHFKQRVIFQSLWQHSAYKFTNLNIFMLYMALDWFIHNTSIKEFDITYLNDPFNYETDKLLYIYKKPFAMHPHYIVSACVSNTGYDPIIRPGQLFTNTEIIYKNL